MHVLVTGANGYLGSVLVPALHASKYVTRVTALVRYAERFTENRPQYLLGTAIEDIQDLIRGEYSMEDVDIICHLAAGRDSTKPGEVASSLDFTSTMHAHLAPTAVSGIINISS